MTEMQMGDSVAALKQKSMVEGTAAVDGVAEPAKPSQGVLQPPTEVCLQELDSSEFIPSNYVDKKTGVQFSALEASEHRATAISLKLTDIYGRQIPSDRVLGTVKAKGGDVELDFGKIIALGGDFYTNKEGPQSYFPICDAELFGAAIVSKSSQTPYQRFENAVSSLIEDKDGFLFDIQRLLEVEHGAIETAHKQDESVAQVYHQHKVYDQHCRIPTDREMAEATGSILNPRTPMFFLYAWLAFTNIDHFGEDAVTAYCVGHTKALQKAREASTLTNESDRVKTLNEAYVREAFCAHFLTDLFSAGHIRSPRRALHTPMYLIMNAAALAENPIWDFQNRFMHDDDSATGIMVQNFNGDQWIEYGDKQFFEPQACVNRARSMHCLQASIKEIYDIGFKGGRDIPEDWKANSQWFAAMKLLPQPMTATDETSPAWLPRLGNYDMHNPAPLWKASVNKPYIEYGWSTRKDLNDHSNFGPREPGTPANVEGPYPSPKCLAIRSAAFCGDDQFPLQLPMNGLLSGGFVQLQDLPAPTARQGICINFWSPVEVVIAGESHVTLTLRNRLIDHDFNAGTTTADQRPNWMHWTRAGDGDASLFGFVWVPSTNAATADIQMVQQAFRPKVFDSGSYNGTRTTLNLAKSWALEATRQMRVLISRDLPAQSGVQNLTRFVQGDFFPGDNRYAPGVLAVTCLPNQHAVQVGLFSNSLDRQTAEHRVSAPASGEIYGFAKRYCAQGHDSLLLARALPQKGRIIVDFAMIDFDNAGVPTTTQASFNFVCKSPGQDSSVLVGDILGVGNDQAVIISGDLSNPNLAVFGHASSSAQTMSACGLHKCSLEYDNPLSRPFLTALVPTCTENAGLDILEISQTCSGNSTFLTFRTHCRANVAAGSEAKLFVKCKQSDAWKDPLASTGDGRYFNIKWMPVRYTEAGKMCRGVLEVFSWYGVLGVRLFGAGPSGWKYGLVGQLPYLGQTSIGAGLGCEGDWGHGFVTWNKDDEWIDANLFRPNSKADGTQGRWGMSKDDAERDNVRGWMVEKRPLA